MTSYRSNVHGWLRDVPGYRENYRNQREIMTYDGSKQFISSHKQRPSSLASISSVDSVNLDDLINANFTTDMDDETDLSALATLELDDSSEDFWKLDNVFSHCIPSPLTITEKPRLLINSLYESEQNPLYNNATEHSFLGPLDLDTPADYDMKLLNMQLHSPSSPLKRTDRFGSFSSEMSSNSQSTIAAANRNAQRQNIYPSASTSTSSVSSHSTAKTSHSSFISRPSITKSESSKTSSRMPCPRKPSLVSSISENTTVDAKLAFASTTRLPSRSVSNISLTRRASHIPSPSSKVNNQLPSSTKTVTRLQRTKSTISSSGLNRSTSRTGEPNTRASHIPSPNVKRSPTSLISSSIFSPQTQTQQPKYQQPSNNYSRPKTSMGTLKSSPTNLRSCLRTPTTISSKPSNLRAPSSRRLYD